MVGKFYAEKKGKMPGQGAGGWLTIYYKEKSMASPIIMAQAEHWCFDSCAAIALSGFMRDYAAHAYWTQSEIVAAFFEFLEDGTFTSGYDHWKPKEFLFLLSKSQITGYGGGDGTMSGLTKHPKVFLRDKWKNKSHEGTVFLYRLSFDDDVTSIALPKKSVPTAKETA